MTRKTMQRTFVWHGQRRGMFQADEYFGQYKHCTQTIHSKHWKSHTFHVRTPERRKGIFRSNRETQDWWINLQLAEWEMSQFWCNLNKRKSCSPYQWIWREVWWSRCKPWILILNIPLSNLVLAITDLFVIFSSLPPSFSPFLFFAWAWEDLGWEISAMGPGNTASWEEKHKVGYCRDGWKLIQGKTLAPVALLWLCVRPLLSSHVSLPFNVSSVCLWCPSLSNILSLQRDS